MKYLSVSIVKVGSSVKFKSTSESAVHSHIYTHCLSCVVQLFTKYMLYRHQYKTSIFNLS